MFRGFKRETLLRSFIMADPNTDRAVQLEPAMAREDKPAERSREIFDRAREIYSRGRHKSQRRSAGII